MSSTSVRDDSTRLDVYLLDDDESKVCLLFGLNELIQLRQSMRICCRLVTGRPKSIQHSIAPVAQLTLIELCCLLEAHPQRVRIFKPTQEEPLSGDRLVQVMADYNEYLASFNAKHCEDFLLKRKQTMADMREKIISGRRKKLLKQLNDPALCETVRRDIERRLENLDRDFDAELEQQTTSQVEEKCEIFLKTPKFYREQVTMLNVDEFRLSQTVNAVFGSCKYKAYKHFWSSGCFLTSGAKFGADFLVYPADPSQSHSQYLLVCTDRSTQTNWPLKQLITYARMAASVKKTFLLAYVDDTCSSLKFLSINWSHI